VYRFRESFRLEKLKTVYLAMNPAPMGTARLLELGCSMGNNCFRFVEKRCVWDPTLRKGDSHPPERIHTHGERIHTHGERTHTHGERTHTHGERIYTHGKRTHTHGERFTHLHPRGAFTPTGSGFTPTGGMSCEQVVVCCCFLCCYNIWTIFNCFLWTFLASVGFPGSNSATGGQNSSQKVQ
jgi:hypothetical protein